MMDKTVIIGYNMGLYPGVRIDSDADCGVNIFTSAPPYS